MIKCPGYDDLVARLDRSVDAGDTAAITQAVKADLDDCKVFLPAAPDGRYAETTKSLSFHE